MDVLLIGAKHNICFIVAVVIIFAYIYISTRIKSTYNQDKTYRNIEQYMCIYIYNVHICPYNK